jgi:hypothetical protein
MKPKWYEMLNEVYEFGTVLRDAGQIWELDQAFEYFEKPWHWQAEYTIWFIDFGMVNEDDERWPDFVEALEDLDGRNW